jgi:hypothetical protein
MLSGQDQQTGQWLNNYSNAIKGQESTTGMYSRLADELGLPGLMNQSSSLNATLEAIPQTYGDATRGFDVNANQLDRIVGTKSAEIAPLAQKATTQAQNAQSQVATQMGLAQQQQAKELQPYEYERQFMADRMARETSLFSQANEQEYNALIAKMNAGITLSEGEKNRANALEVQKRAFDNAKETAATSNRYISVGTGGLFDTQTGKSVAFGKGVWS